MSYSAETAGVSILDTWGSCSWAEHDCWSCQFRKQGSTSSPNSEARHSVSAMRRLGFALKMCISVWRGRRGEALTERNEERIRGKKIFHSSAASSVPLWSERLERVTRSLQGLLGNSRVWLFASYLIILILSSFKYKGFPRLTVWHPGNLLQQVRWEEKEKTNKNKKKEAIL